MLARALSFISGATASSRSKIRPSAGRARAFSSARGLEPGRNSTLRRSRSGGSIVDLHLAPRCRYNSASGEGTGRDRNGKASVMNQSSRAPASGGRRPVDPRLGAWIGFWAELAVLGLLAVFGAVFASQGRAPGDYACGLILSLAAIALAFLRLKARFDGVAAGWGSFLLVEDIANLVAAIVAFAVLALGGLFAAAHFDQGGLHDA